MNAPPQLPSSNGKPRRSLSGRHRKQLQESGLSSETIETAGLYTEADARQVSDVLGWPYPAKKLVPCLAFPFFDAVGQLTDYLRYRPDNPLAPNRKYESPKGKSNRAYFPPMLALRDALADSMAPLFITEGEKKCLKATQEGFPCIGLIGVEGWSVKREKDISGKPKGRRQLLPDLEAIAWNGRPVFICYDSDAATKPEVVRAESSLAAALTAAGAVVKIVRLPNEADGKKNGVDDFLVRHGPEQLRELIANAIEPMTPAEQFKKQAAEGMLPAGMILVTHREYQVIADVTATLAEKDAALFQRGGQLVRVIRPAKPPSKKERFAPSGGLRIEPAPSADLRTRITRHCRLKQEAGDDLVDINPPKWLTPGVEAQAAPWDGIRPLEAVTETPLLRPDGTILQVPGYDIDTGILFAPTCTFPSIPANPTRGDAIVARDELLEVVCDFPFAAPMHGAAWLASLLTPLSRPAYDGPAPLFLTDANIRGCGKGLSADCAAIISTGRIFAVAQYSHDPVEMAKTITAIALAGEPVVLFDNLAGTFGNAALDAAITATDWQGRILGKSEQPRVPLNCVWYATGNNCIIGADTARRICHIRIESPDERPEERESFRHPDLRAWVRQERPRLLRAALTVLAAYCAAGRPQARLKPWGSFECWSDLVRQCVVWLDLPDPAESRVALTEEADQDVTLLRVLMSAFAAVVPTGESAHAAEFLEKIKKGKPDSILKETPDPSLRPHFDALTTLMPGRDGSLPTPRQLGNALRRFKGRVCDGRCFTEKPDRKGVAEWRLIDRCAVSAVCAVSISTDDARRTHANTHASTGREDVSGNIRQVTADTANGGATDDLARPAWAGDAWEGDS